MWCGSSHLSGQGWWMGRNRAKRLWVSESCVWLGWEMGWTNPRTIFQGLRLHKWIYIHPCNLRVSLFRYYLENKYKPPEEESPPVIFLSVASGNLCLNDILVDSNFTWWGYIHLRLLAEYRMYPEGKENASYFWFSLVVTCACAHFANHLLT